VRVIRVFPRKTSFTPTDAYAFVGNPPMIRPEADYVYISCVFSWDVEEAKRLFEAWEQYYKGITHIGGPAFENDAGYFMPGRFVKQGITFTSRGCNNNCPWCLVPKREGKLRTDPVFRAGHIIQDNNLLQCHAPHIKSVFEMLRYQGKAATFSGGIDATLVTDWFADELRTITIDQIFLAADTKSAITPLRKAVAKIGLPRSKVRCYALTKFDPNETIDQAEERMRLIWEAGAMPFAQLYQPPERYIEYTYEWLAFQRTWQRPAAMIARMKALDSTGGAE